MNRLCIVMITVWGLGAAALAEQPSVQDSPSSPQSDVQQVDTGYVFIDGKYISPPYLVGEENEGVTVNGHLISAPIPSPMGARTGFNPSRIPNSGLASHSPGRRNVGSFLPSSQRRVAHRLSNGCMLLAFEPERLVVLERRDAEQLLGLFANSDGGWEAYKDFLKGIPNEIEREILGNWLVSYRPSEDLLARADSLFQARSAAESANRTQNAAVRRISNFTYPSSLLGMVLAVLATGHLLTTRPTQSEEELSDGQRSKLNRATLISVTLVLFFSALDLTWTILAAQAGQMRELNPVGARLIEDPVSLIVFKSATTLMSCGILLALRHYHIARLASWWLCLACTIVAFRWLTFHSMFIS